MRDWRGEGSVSWLFSCSTNKWLSLGSNQMQYEGKQSLLIIDLLSLLLVLQIVKEIKLKDRDCIPLLDQGAAGQSLASSFHFITIKNNQIKVFFQEASFNFRPGCSGYGDSYISSAHPAWERESRYIQCYRYNDKNRKIFQTFKAFIFIF